MVYRGKLGKGCAECRAKKTRCDAARPTCGQCRRAGRTCSGYRNLNSLRMVDQTSEVKSKLSKNLKGDNSPAAVSSDSGGASANSPSASSTSSSEDLMEVVSGVRSFVNPKFWATYGSSYVFFDQFISVFADHPKTELDFVASLYGDAPADGMLANIISALGFVALPQQMKTRTLMLLAHEKYCNALKQTQKALQDPVLAKSDETLATVLMLGLHELVGTDTEPLSDAARLSVHLSGSIKLVQLRGDAGMDHMAGTRMFGRLCSQTSLYCVHNRQRIPPALLAFQRTMTHHFHAEEIMGAELLEITARLCDVLASTTIAEPSKIATHFRMLVAIDADLERWEAGLSWRYRHKRVNVKSHADNFLHQQAVYQNHIAASTMNRYRCVRIQTNEEIIRLAEILPSALVEAGMDVPLAIQVATSKIVRMSEDICYTLPYVFGMEACRMDQEGVEYQSKSAMYGAALMLGPIFFASNSKRVTLEMYQWLMQHIKRIGERNGIARAKFLYAQRTMLDAVG